MNRKNPEYPDLIREVVEGMVEVVKEKYAPYFEAASMDDLCHYELHIICSFLMRFLIKMRDVSKAADGSAMTIQRAFDELCTILQSCISDYEENKEKIEH